MRWRGGGAKQDFGGYEESLEYKRMRTMRGSGGGGTTGDPLTRFKANDLISSVTNVWFLLSGSRAGTRRDALSLSLSLPLKHFSSNLIISLKINQKKKPSKNH